MKKAFTMIELIFVIVILGILAAVAIPKLNATRDDAELVKGASDFATAISDIASYYTANGKFANKIQDMTNVVLQPHIYGNKSSAHIYLKKLNCVTINADTNGSDIKIFASPDYNKGICVNFFTNSSVSQIMGGSDIKNHLRELDAYKISLGA
ncbi:type II secretion system protein, partial [Campylobacter sp. Cr9]|nr:type II secretion system protein [Campylobacter sp. Cr9]